jgi:hypothetical protein
MDQMEQIHNIRISTWNIYEIGKNNIELEKWFDPDFQKFINDEMVPTIKKKII